MTVCYFSATGNSLYVAKRIGGRLLSIPHLMKTGQLEITDDAVGIVCPVYAVEMPMMVREFLSRATIKTDYFFFIYTYGSGYAEAFAHARLAAEEAGLKMSYVNAIQMVDNYLPMFEMQQQMDTLGQKDVEGQLWQVLRDIETRQERTVTITLETMRQIELYRKMLAFPILRKDTAQGYLVNDSCTHCGICARVCPADNITVTEDQVIFATRCEVCYACLQNCPRNALHMSSERSAVRFRNEHIKLKEIMEANE